MDHLKDTILNKLVYKWISELPKRKNNSRLYIETFINNKLNNLSQSNIITDRQYNYAKEIFYKTIGGK